MVTHRHILPVLFIRQERLSLLKKKNAKQAERKGRVIKGIKGRSVITSILDLPLGAPVDYMHCVLEGVVKRFLNKWITSTNQPYYISKRNVKLLDQDFVVQCPPHEFTRPPRSIEKHRNYWKASEHRTWLLFYSLPLLLSFLPPLYIHHFALLVCAVHILLQQSFTEIQLKAAEEMLRDFVSLTPELYGETECTINMHMLLHLAEQAQQWGPLWGFSAFPFEHKNGYIMSHVHSPYRIADQILFSIHLSQTLDSVQEQLTDASDDVLSFLKLSRETHGNGQQLTCGGYVIGRMYNFAIDSEARHLIADFTDDCPSSVMRFNRVYYSGIVLHSIHFGRADGKRDSTTCSFIANGKEHYGIIQNFLVVEKKAIVLIKPFVPSGSLNQTIGIPGREVLQKHACIDILAAFIIQVEKKRTLPIIAVTLQSITSKCIRVQQISEQYDCIVKIPNSFECH